MCEGRGAHAAAEPHAAEELCRNQKPAGVG